MPDNGLEPKQRTFPAVSRPDERAAAAERRAEFPYRFPRDARQIGGKYTVAENARRLLRFFYFERRLMQALGAWTLGIPEFEVKIETGRHIFYHGDAARTLRERLTEQETRPAHIDGYRNDEIDRFIDEMLSAADTPELLVGVHEVAGAALKVAYRHHIDDTDPVTDAPTIRARKRVLVDYEPMLRWADEAIAAYVEGGVEESRLAAWRWHLKRVLGSIGGVAGADSRNDEPVEMRVDAKPFARPTVPARDSRFVAFNDTGDYDKGDGGARFPANSYETYRMIFMRTQRDESTRSRRSARSSGTSRSRTSMRSTISRASHGTRRGTRRLGIARWRRRATTRSSCLTGSAHRPAAGRWSRSTRWRRSICSARWRS